MIHKTAAIGLLNIPPEIQLQIAEFVETRQTLRALSVTSRSLRSIAQSMLFENLEINLGKELRGSVDDLLANPRICAAIRFLRLRGGFFFSSVGFGSALGSASQHHLSDRRSVSLVSRSPWLSHSRSRFP